MFVYGKTLYGILGYLLYSSNNFDPTIKPFKCSYESIGISLWFIYK